MNAKGYFVLLRPANLVTAVADILAGMAIVSFPWVNDGIFLILASVCLYGGGVVLNDFFDREIDAKERPERPIPSGKVRAIYVLLFGFVLLAFGCFFSFLYSEISFIISISIVFLILLYDRFAKHNLVFGPLVMGMCRGLNLILGMTILKSLPLAIIPISILPIVYIAAITLISQNEVWGGGKYKFIIACMLYILVFFTQLFVSFQNGFILYAMPFIVFHSVLLFPPLLKAYQNPNPKLIGNAVKIGVLTLIVLNVSFAASFGNLPIAISILALLPISLLISKYFAVT